MSYIIKKIIILIPVLVAVLIYSNTLVFDQYVLDDEVYTIKNSYVQKGIHGLPEIILNSSTKGFDGVEGFAYRPLVLASFALEKYILGNNPIAGHVINVLLYAVLCSLLLWLMKMLFESYSIYFILAITLLFALHPIHTEVVANIKGRDEILCMIFGILTLITVFYYKQVNKIAILSLSCLSFFFCILSKESGYAYIGLIPLILYFFTDLRLNKILAVMIPFIGVVCITILMRYVVLGRFINSNEAIPIIDNSLLAATSFSDQYATNCTVLLHALYLLVFPLNLSYDYSFNFFPIVTWLSFGALFSLMIHIALIVIAIVGSKKKRVYSFAIWFYLLSYLISSNLIVKMPSSFGERFLFTPSLGFCIILTYVLFKATRVDFKSENIKSIMKVILPLVVVFSLYSFKTVTRNTDWRDNISLITSGIKTSPNSVRVHYHLADEYSRKTRDTKDTTELKSASVIALREYEKVLELYPEDSLLANVYYNMGMIHYVNGNEERSTSLLKKALELGPRYPSLLESYGAILLDKKDYKTALIYFEKAIQYSSDPTNSYAFAGWCEHQMGNYSNAAALYEKALERKPDYVNVLVNIAEVYKVLGNSSRAQCYESEIEKLNARKDGN